MTALEDHHRIALTRERTAIAGCPLRDRYGYAASDTTVSYIYEAVAQCPSDVDAATMIDVAIVLGDIELAVDYEPAELETLDAVVQAVRPLVEERRDAAARGLRP